MNRAVRPWSFLSMHDNTSWFLSTFDWNCKELVISPHTLCDSSLGGFEPTTLQTMVEWSNHSVIPLSEINHYWNTCIRLTIMNWEPYSFFQDWSLILLQLHTLIWTPLMIIHQVNPHWLLADVLERGTDVALMEKRLQMVLITKAVLKVSLLQAYCYFSSFCWTRPISWESIS